MLHKVFDDQSFYKAFANDLREARALVLIQSPFLSERRIGKLQSLLEGCQKRRVRVCAFVQQPLDPARVQAVGEMATMLTSLGVHVTFRKFIHEKIAVIDESILWDGSLNILSQSESSERMTRWTNREMVFEAIIKHRLNACAVCSSRLAPVFPNIVEANDQLKFLGRCLSRRRKELRISQSELAKQAGVVQPVISYIETGRRAVAINQLMRVCWYFNLELRPVPWYFLPTLEDNA